MIQKQTVTVWKDSNGIEHRTLHEVKVRELSLLLNEHGDADEPVAIAETMIANDKKFVDLLTTTESSIPLARSINGNKRPRKKHIAPQLSLPGVPEGTPPVSASTT